MVKMGIAQEQLEIPESEVEELKNMATDLKEEEIQLLFDITLAGTQKVAYSRDPAIGVRNAIDENGFPTKINVTSAVDCTNPRSRHQAINAVTTPTAKHSDLSPTTDEQPTRPTRAPHSSHQPNPHCKNTDP